MKESRSLNFTLLNIGVALHNGDWNWQNTNSPFSRIYLVDEGEAYVLIGKEEIHLRPGFLYLVPAFTTHSYRCEGVFHLNYIHVYEDPQEKSESLFDCFEFPRQVEECAIDAPLVKRLLEINPNRNLLAYNPDSYNNEETLHRTIALHTQSSYPVRVESAGIIAQLFARFLEKSKSKSLTEDDRLKRVLNRIQTEIDCRISTNRLADAVHMSEDHLIRLFKREMNETPINYINRKKIERAQLLIIIRDSPIKEIALSLGFENISYFNRLFKQRVGVSPSEYRTNNKTIYGLQRNW